MSEDLKEFQEKLRAYVSKRMPGVTDLRVEGLRRMAEGWSRESFAFMLVTVEDGNPVSRPLIIRRDPVASLLDTDREVEFRVIEALWSRGMAVPRVFWLEKDASLLGAPFMVMAMLPGTAVPEVLYAPGFAAQRRALGRQFFRFLGELHSLDPASLGIEDVLRPPGDGVRATLAELNHWDGVVETKKSEPQPVLREVSLWLRRNVPPAKRISLLHGDYRSGNFLFEDDRISGVVDWEMASLGNPMQDLGWVFMDLWRNEGNVCGFFPDGECLAHYRDAGGIEVDREELPYWMVFNYYKLSAIAMQSIRTALDGRNKEIQFATSHLWVPSFLDFMARSIGF